MARSAKAKPRLEKDILRDCLTYLVKVRGWLAWRNNSGGVRTTYKNKHGVDKERFFKFNSAEGSSDIFFVTPTGRFGCVETKRPGNKPTEKQEAWLSSVRSTGGIAIVATSVDELIVRLYQEIGKEPQ